MTQTALTVESFTRGSEGYEQARTSIVANARVPERFPDIIVRPTDEAGVVEAIRYAVEHDMKVGIRSGGHSWSASFLRDGGMLLDLGGLNQIEVDPVAKVAKVGPGALGRDINPALTAHNLAFPHGHDNMVGVGGFLLQGGFGWNSREWGLACQNIIAMDVVTADGQLVHVDDENHPDLKWAARGAGPGYFAVVTRFYLRLFPLPHSMYASYVYSEDGLDDVMLWIEKVLPDIPPDLEVSVLISRDAIILRGDALGDDEDECRRLLGLFDSLPGSLDPVYVQPPVSVSVEELMVQVHDALGVGTPRFEVDNMWTGAPMKDLLPHLRDIQQTLPPFPSHLYVLVWGPCRELPDMALSLQEPYWLALHAAGEDPEGDAERVRYVTEHMRAMESLSIGMNIGGENLANRPAPFMTEERFARLETIRDRYDPTRRFHSYMGRS